MADLSAGGAEVVLRVVVEVATEAAGVILVGAWKAHLQVRTTTPQHLGGETTSGSEGGREREGERERTGRERERVYICMCTIIVLVVAAG